MTTKERTDNELIAEFHNGITFDKDGFCTDYERKYSWRPGCYDPLRIEHLNYHTSWDWLMPVVEKAINVLDEIKTKSSDPHIHGIVILEEVFNALAWVDIKTAHEQIVEFIKWYNSQPLTQ